MKIFVSAKPNAKEGCIEKIDPPSPMGFGGASSAHFKISVKEPPRHGAANRAIARALAEYFNVPPSRMRLVSGFSAKKKVFEIL